ncbi:uncharacterized protein LOC100833372 [Brachypodium distachyon]|uniref:uncharacterized protein LOC100833372 n=1 Tax=Brachypodium distachyon TaxID=15368 RepID=UPI00071D9B74|nr:uncharacterized protein LOC100833372 [Brachypodium distachyon]|eukprot:XP_014754041.1 uncharacterized protein LOC100833372 [Brachypodium distachyon]
MTLSTKACCATCYSLRPEKIVTAAFLKKNPSIFYSSALLSLIFAQLPPLLPTSPSLPLSLSSRALSLSPVAPAVLPSTFPSLLPRAPLNLPLSSPLRFPRRRRAPTKRRVESRRIRWFQDQIRSPSSRCPKGRSRSWGRCRRSRGGVGAAASRSVGGEPGSGGGESASGGGDATTEGEEGTARQGGCKQKKKVFDLHLKGRRSNTSSPAPRSWSICVIDLELRLFSWDLGLIDLNMRLSVASGICARGIVAGLEMDMAWRGLAEAT